MSIDEAGEGGCQDYPGLAQPFSQGCRRDEDACKGQGNARAVGRLNARPPCCCSSVLCRNAQIVKIVPYATATTPAQASGIERFRSVVKLVAARTIAIWTIVATVDSVAPATAASS